LLLNSSVFLVAESIHWYVCVSREWSKNGEAVQKSARNPRLWFCWQHGTGSDHRVRPLSIQIYLPLIDTFHTYSFILFSASMFVAMSVNRITDCKWIFSSFLKRWIMLHWENWFSCDSDWSTIQYQISDGIQNFFNQSHCSVSFTIMLRLAESVASVCWLLILHCQWIFQLQYESIYNSDTACAVGPHKLNTIE